MDCGGEDVEVTRIRGPIIYHANRNNRECTAPKRSSEGVRMIVRLSDSSYGKYMPLAR